MGNLASTYYERGQLDLAILHYKQAIACDQRFLEAYNNLENALKDMGRVDEAIQCYSQCLTLQPNHPQALTNLGNIYMEWNMVAAVASGTPADEEEEEEDKTSRFQQQHVRITMI